MNHRFRMLAWSVIVAVVAAAYPTGAVAAPKPKPLSPQEVIKAGEIVQWLSARPQTARRIFAALRTKLAGQRAPAAKRPGAPKRPTSCCPKPAQGRCGSAARPARPCGCRGRSPAVAGRLRVAVALQAMPKAPGPPMPPQVAGIKAEFERRFRAEVEGHQRDVRRMADEFRKRKEELERHAKEMHKRGERAGREMEERQRQIEKAHEALERRERELNERDRHLDARAQELDRLAEKAEKRAGPRRDKPAQKKARKPRGKKSGGKKSGRSAKSRK